MLEIHRIGPSAVHDAFLARASAKALDPADARGLLDRFARLSVQFFGEHCTECAAPECHASCDLFERGPVGRCRRFLDGIVARPCDVGPIPYALDVVFKPSASLLAVANAWCAGPRAYRAGARAALAAGRASYLLQSWLRFLPPRLQWRVTDRIRGAGNKLPPLLSRHASAKPEALAVIAGNPHAEPIALEISLSGFADSQGGRSCRRTVTLASGWNLAEIPMAEIEPAIDVSKLFRIALVPLIESPKMLQILYAGFVRRAAARDVQSADELSPAGIRGGPRPPGGGERLDAPLSCTCPRPEVAGHPTEGRPIPGQTVSTPLSDGPAAKKVKAVVLDLDETLWDGILVEDLRKERALRPGVREALVELDRRGILLSIASKNNVEDVRPVLERLGVWDLFLHPQVSWNPKSAGVGRIVERLNIGADTVVFVDDSAFEREEVSAAVPGVRALDARELPGLPARPEFDVPVSDDSSRRRALYRDEERRQEEFGKSAAGYEAFLASCRIEVVLDRMSAETEDRVLELIQRTNQLNFSGNRYSREDLRGLLQSGVALPVAMSCRDRFGDYGIVGFALVAASRAAVELKDLMFSCRVQGKKVEHAFLGYVARQAAVCGQSRFVCYLKRTARNAPAARVFDDLGFRKEDRPGPGGAEVRTLDASGAAQEFPVTVVDRIGLKDRLEEMILRTASAGPVR